MSGMEFIAKVDVPSGGQPVVQFNTIPGEYTDLLIVLSSRSTRTPQNADGFVVKMNGTTPSLRNLLGINGSVTTATSAAGISTALGETANTFGSTTIYIPNYSSTTQNKLFYVDSVAENNTVNGYVLLSANLYSSNTAVTSITIEHINANFAEYSSATLYGIKKYNTTNAPKATGGIISFDSVNNKWVHTFTASGTFTPTENLTAEYLVIAGGGGCSSAGNNQAAWGAGGGGAGGYRSSVVGESSGANSSAESPLAVAVGSYTVTVGAGGPANSDTNGSNSVFSTVTSLGGGHSSNFSSNTGGSGNGGTINLTPGGSGTANQGRDGGTAGQQDTPTTYRGSGGGGGGASGQGGNGVTNGAGGTRGAGLSSSITGSSVTRAVGGEGGANNVNNSSVAGGINTGNGADGGGAALGGPSATGAAGGSGIVIVRYSA